MNKQIFTITIVCVYMYPLHVLAVPDVKMPVIVPMNDMKLSWVAEKYFYNGYPMSIQKFYSPKQYDEILKHYEVSWGVERRGAILSLNDDNEYVLGYQLNNYSYTILVSNFKNHSQGYLIVSHNKQYNFNDSIISLRAGDLLISRTHSIDRNIMTETLIIESQHSYDENILSYRKMIEKAGWALVNSEINNNSRKELLTKNKSYCQINSNRDLRSNNNVIVIHIVNENLK